MSVNPLLLEFPDQFETEQFIIRSPRPGDGKALNEAIVASINELLPWMEFAQSIPTVEESEINIRKAYTKFLNREDLRLLAFHKETGQLACSSGLHRINWKIPKFEIGYWTDSRLTGKGYTTEIVNGITDFAFSELKAKRLEIQCDAKNEGSQAVAEKVGFELEGILRNHSLSVNGTELRDTCVYSKIV
ncbi:GNAT family N-acetyltransferase [Alkalibacillus aidingensis]|uniref:GNAT family N-acetyltransferase n=1 Tax=Alkalibacillus aidingensis TaxID=2747607 RepID=UPI0016604DE0|nr:GNAT family protein [Alkalibacillus aidingensis]